MDLMNHHGAAPARALGTTCHDGNGSGLVDEAASLSALWTELVGGFCKVEESLFTDRNCGLVVTRGQRPAGRQVALSKRHADVLERSLIEGARKSVAIDLGLCPSSVAEILKQGFTFMGLSCWPSRIPLLLVMAAHAKRAPELERRASLIAAENQRFLRQTISAIRPDKELSARLSPAEYEVTRLLVEGKSYAEMAVLRQTSARTVANQIASAFHRLGVSGRAELLCLLAKRKVVSWQLPTPITRASRQSAESRSGFLRVAGGQRR
jgi:DNA-binding CsgD family transcriptional regulator